MTRPDRNNYIWINWDLLRHLDQVSGRNSSAQYNKYTGNVTYVTPYDYNSIMHYPSKWLYTPSYDNGNSHTDLAKNCHNGHCNPNYEKYYNDNNLPFFLKDGGKIPRYSDTSFFDPSGGLIGDKLLISSNDFKTVNHIYRNY